MVGRGVPAEPSDKERLTHAESVVNQRACPAFRDVRPTVENSLRHCLLLYLRQRFNKLPWRKSGNALEHFGDVIGVAKAGFNGNRFQRLSFQQQVFRVFDPHAQVRVDGRFAGFSMVTVAEC